MPAGNNEVDRSTVSYAVDGDKQGKIFNIMFALGEPSLLCSCSLREGVDMAFENRLSMC